MNIENAPRRKADHRIQEVHFQRTAELGLPMDQAPLCCTCGAWVTSGTWESHRGLTADGERVKRNHAAWKERQAA